MRLLLIALLSSILLFGACFNKKPKNILSEKQMIALLTEVHVLDGYLLTLPTDSNRKVMDTLYAQVFAKYNLDSATFSKNVDYYYADPVKTEKMYEKIYGSLESYQKELNRQDSIRHALERDSISRANHYQMLLNNQQNMLKFYPDTNYTFDRNEYIRSMYQPAGLLYIWQNINIPMPARAEPPPSPATPETLTLPEEELPRVRPIRRDPDVVEDRPMTLEPDLEDIERTN